MSDLRKLIDHLEHIERGGELVRELDPRTECIVSISLTESLGKLLGTAALGAATALGVNKFFSDKPESDKDLDKNTAPEKPAGNSTASTGPAAVSGPITSSDYDPESIQAREGNKFYRPAKFWGDGADPNNRYMDQFKVDPDTEWAKDDWGKIFVNYNGTPIRSRDRTTWPKEPKHPFYQFVFSDNAPASVRGKVYGRTNLRDLMLKDKYGRTQLEYDKPSTQLPIEFDSPTGYRPSDVSQIDKQLPDQAANLAAGLRGPNGAAILISWRPRNYMAHHSSYDDQHKGAYQDDSPDTLKGLADYYGGKLSDSTYVGLDNKLFGYFNAKSFIISKGFSSMRVVAGVMRVATKDSAGAHTDDIVIRYWGPDSEWKQSGQAALASLVASIRPRKGIDALSNAATNNPLTNNSSLSEELARILDLALKV
jgi:hypothetical protein